MNQFILSPAAKNSLIQIKAYSQKQFGLKQTKAYLQNINFKFKQLAKNPQLGICRDEIKPGYRSVIVGSHTIYFRIGNKGIEVIDLLHQSMEPSKHRSKAIR